MGVGMVFRLAVADDLPKLCAVFGEIVKDMDRNNICIWDDVYPCTFFTGDIDNGRLYVLEENEQIVSAFALCDSNAGADSIIWENRQGKALYLDRFGVNVDFARKGIGTKMLDFAVELAKGKGAETLRLFVVDVNMPAINLYRKIGFRQAAGVYHQYIGDGVVLREFGFEIGTDTGFERSAP